MVCGGRVPVPVCHHDPYGCGDELEDDLTASCSPHGSHRCFLCDDGLPQDRKGRKETGRRGEWSGIRTEGQALVLKNTGFLLAVGALFFYMGLENSVNGWFVTYLKSTGFMSASLATVMVSVTWIMIMIGRIVIASISKNAAGKDPGCDLRSSVCLGADPCIRRQYGDGGGSPGSSRSWHGGRIPDNDGLYRRSHGKFPA